MTDNKERDCENCKHHKETCRNGIFYHSCESWDCVFEPKKSNFRQKADITSAEGCYLDQGITQVF